MLIPLKRRLKTSLRSDFQNRFLFRPSRKNALIIWVFSQIVWIVEFKETNSRHTSNFFSFHFIFFLFFSFPFFSFLLLSFLFFSFVPFFPFFYFLLFSSLFFSFLFFSSLFFSFLSFLFLSFLSFTFFFLLFSFLLLSFPFFFFYILHLSCPFILSCDTQNLPSVSACSHVMTSPVCSSNNTDGNFTHSEPPLL